MRTNIPLYLSLLSLISLSLTSALTPDGTLLLSFKYSILSDPLSVLDNWAYSDPTPCSWAGITCGPTGSQVVGLALPHSQLVGSIPEDIGFIEHLIKLDLSDNFLNGSLPGSLFNHSELRSLSLSDNEFSGELPEIPTGGVGLQVLNLSNNALAGKLPENLPNSKNLTVISLKSNHFSGPIPSGFDSVEILDLSSNSLNGSLPIGFGGERLTILNLSNNNLSGSVSSKFASKIPQNASVNLSFNDLSGEIPTELDNRKTDAFANNLGLCGKPLKNLCTIASSISIPPNITTSSPAIAAIPRSIGSSPETNNTTENAQTRRGNGQKGIKLGTILGIIVGDLAGIGILGVIFMYVYRMRMKKNRGEETGEVIVVKRDIGGGEMKEEKGYGGWGCIGANVGESSEEEGISSSSNVSDCDESNKLKHGGGGMAVAVEEKKSGLVMVDVETKLELETLLKASAYILGSSGSSIVYKAVLQDGTSFAVRRIGEGVIERLRDFEGQIRTLAKMCHPNLVRIRGFYWGDDEKLVIYDYVSNGSLACSTGYKRMGSSSTHYSFELRLKIARGMAQGLNYIHEKKQVHGNIKPSNILLTPEIDPVISDLGLDRLLSSDKSQYRSVASTSAYQAPESFNNPKPNQKWDVYSFGVVFLELLTGRVFSGRELDQWATGPAAVDMKRMVKMVDVAIRADVADREDAMVACLKLGFGCASLVPQKRPFMKEVVQVLEKMP